MKLLIYAIGITLALVAWGMLGKSDNLEAEKQRETYCEMVEIHNETGGEYGWPPYRDNIECEG